MDTYNRRPTQNKLDLIMKEAKKRKVYGYVLVIIIALIILYFL